MAEQEDPYQFALAKNGLYIVRSTNRDGLTQLQIIPVADIDLEKPVVNVMWIKKDGEDKIYMEVVAPDSEEEKKKVTWELVESDDPDGGADEIQLSQSDDPTDYIQNYIKIPDEVKNYFILRATTADGKKTAQKVYDNQAKLQKHRIFVNRSHLGNRVHTGDHKLSHQCRKGSGRKSYDPTD